MIARIGPRLAAVLIGPSAASEEPTVEQTIFRAMTAVAAGVSLVVGPISLLLQRPLSVALACLICGLLMVALHTAARHGRYLLKTTFVMAVATTAVAWFPSSGSAGSSLLYQGSSLIYAIVMFRGRARVVSVVGLTVMNLVLLTIEALHPEFSEPFRNPMAHGIEVGTGLIFSVLLGSLILGTVVTAYDRERMRLRASVAALHASREQWRQLFDLNPDAVCVVDERNGRVLEVNRGFEHRFGWSRSDIDAHPIEDAVLWDNAESRAALLDALATRDQVLASVTRGRRRDGSAFWASLSAGWLHTSGGRRLLLAFRDITERIQTRQDLAESRATLAALVNSTSDMVWLVEAGAFGLTQFNAAFAEYCRRELGVTVAPGATPDAVHSTDAATWRGYYARALSEGPFHVEHVSQGLRILWLSFNPVQLDGAVLGVSAFSRDITELRAQELARADIERQLLQAQKMESLGRLAGGVAHDFNNMLTAITGHAQLLRRDEADPGRREQLDTIVQAAARSGDLTRKLLAFGRRGKNVVEPVYLRHIVRDCVALLTPSLRPDVRVVPDLQDSWAIDGDPTQISQIVLNLCMNANEAMPHGGVIRLATADRVVSDHVGHVSDVVELAVTDTGVGMNDDVKSRAFEPFFTTKPPGNTSGTGLGLSTVDGVVHLHGGTVEIDSAVGRGSCVTVRLPRGRVAQGPGTPPASVVAGTGLILVVDDEELLRSMTAKALKTMGYETVVATDGVEGVQLFREHQRALAGVMLDLKMPRMNGSDAFAAMRACDPHVPILICSGYGDNEEAQRLIQAGASGLLSKPFTLDELSRALTRLRTTAS